MKLKSIFLWILLSLSGIVILSCNQEAAPVSQKQPDSDNSLANPPWFEALIPAYRTLQAGDTEKAADLLLAAANRLPKKDWEIYLVAATLFATHQKHDLAFQAIDQSINAGLRDNSLLQSLPELAPLREDTRWQALEAKVLANETLRKERIQKPDLLDELEDMWAADQAAWQSFGKVEQQLRDQGKLEERRSRIAAIETLARGHQKRLQTIIEQHGWPGFSALGEEGAKFSWAIAQHAPDIFAKETFLFHLKNAVSQGDADPNHVAELADRISRDTWQKQIYGSSMANKAPHPIEDPARVDQRRLALGLQYPVEVYASFHNIEYKRPSLEQAHQEAEKAQKQAQAHYADFLEASNLGHFDKAHTAINDAIDFYGDLTNEQLYQAALTLAQTNHAKSENTSLKILRVLIWRRWPQRFDIQTEPKLKALHSQDSWQEILGILKESLKGNDETKDHKR